MHLKAKFVDVKNPKFKWETYANNDRPALRIINEHGEVECTATINLPDVAIPYGCALIKDYAEGEGILNELIRLKIVGPAIGYIGTGYVTIPYCRILP